MAFSAKSMDALNKAQANPGVRAAINEARAANVPWLAIMAKLVSLLPAIAAKDWPAVIAGILSLFQK